MSLRRRLSAHAALIAIVAVLALLVAAVLAYAYYTATGTGSASASIGTLPAPSIANATPGAGSVSLSWSAVTAPGSGAVAYSVERDGGAAGGTCPTAAAPAAVLSCTDSGVATGAHSYTVTATWRTWSGTSASANATVAYGPVTQLVVTTQPSGATGGSAFTTQPVVTAKDAGGITVPSYSGTVTLSIKAGTGTSGAALSGCSGSLSNGVTSFSGCKIDLAGTGYRLTASDGTRSADTGTFNVTAGALARLVFTQQPSGAVAGAAFTTQPKVTAQDAGGNTVMSYAGTVALSIGTNPGGGTLSGCSQSRSAGVVTFSGCKIEKSGVGYVLHAADGAAAGDSAAFTVTAGAVSQLAFTTQPVGATGGLALATQPVVTAQDANGNTVTSYSGTVSLTLRNGGAATLSGCSGTRVNGVVSFTGCTVDKSGSGYQLRASDGTRVVDSSTFGVTVGPLAQLAFTQQPSGAVAGAAFTTQPKVTAQDAGGNTVTSYAGTVALSIGTNPGGGTLSGCSQSRSAGVVTFSGCKIEKSGVGYVLHAADGAAAGDSAAFTVTAGAATQLLFTTQPSGATGATAFTTQSVITAYDANGNVATGYSGSIALSIKSGTGAAGAALSGCSSTIANGVVTFGGCAIDKAGTGYVLRAVEGVRTAESAAFAVTPGAFADLLVTTDPAGATGGVAFTTQPVVAAVDAGGNVVTGFAGTVTLTIRPGSNPSGGTLSGCAGSLSNGVTTFSGCKIDKAGTGYRLRATSGGANDDTGSFNVTVGPAAALVLASADTTPIAGSANDVTITAVDAGGNTATSYTGTKSIVFGGASDSLAGAHPTVGNSSSVAIAFGSTTTLSFSSGVSSTAGSSGSMILRKAETASITVTDGTLTNGAGLTVTVSAGSAANLAWTSLVTSGGTLSSPCWFTCTVSSIGNAGTFTARVSVTDADGNVVSGIGSAKTIALARTSGTGTFTSPTSGTTTSVTVPSTGTATSSTTFTFAAPSGSWTTTAFQATNASYGTATATLSK